MNRIEENNKNR